MFRNPYQTHPIPSPRTLYSNSDINVTAHTKRGSTQQKKGRNKRAIFSGSFRAASVRLCLKCLFGCETMASVTKNNTTTSTGMDLLFCDVIVGSADTAHTGREPLPLVLQLTLILNVIQESLKQFCSCFKSTDDGLSRGGRGRIHNVYDHSSR